jgi:hypothetical protein
MTRLCTVCTHKDVEEINKLLLCSGSYRDIARQFGLSKDSLARHKEGHIPELLSKSNDIKEIASADSLLTKLDEEANFVREMRVLAAAEGDIELALKAVDRALKCIDLYAKVSGLIQDQPTINLNLNAEWIELRTLIVTALDPYPQAKEAVVNAIRGR